MGNENGTRLMELAVAMIGPAEAAEMLDIVDAALHPREGGTPVLKRLRDGSHSTAFTSLALHVSRLVREIERGSSAACSAPRVRTLLNLRERVVLRALAGTAPGSGDGDAGATAAQVPMTIEEGIHRVYQVSVGRAPGAEEIGIWKTNFSHGLPFHEFLLLMCTGPEAKARTAGMVLLGGRSDGECVQLAYEIIMGRGAAAIEIEHWMERLETGSATRAELVASLFETSLRVQADLAGATVHDGLTCLIMGTGRLLTADQWRRQAEDMQGAPAPEPDRRYAHRFPIRREPGVLVSALCSLYRGGDFIEQFMDNLTSQSCFDDYAELVIVDADSPEDEYETIKRYLAKHKNINYMRMNYRLGIYDAWNVAAKAARGEYLTNTNLDDLRRHDSLEIQAGVLDNLPFVDVVYQDLYYSFDPRLSFAGIAAFGQETTLPVITPHNMIRFNSPHNAPMWRKRLHDELGYFDVRYRSAGDHEFWMRCLAAGKQFYKTNDPHVAYYQNPKGLSTRPDTRGVVEAMEIHKTYCRKIIPAEAVMPTGLFRDLVGASAAGFRKPTRDRFAMAQAALRDLARTGKFGAAGGVA